MIATILGFIAGFIIGIIVMAICAVSGRTHDWEEYNQAIKEMLQKIEELKNDSG